MTVKPVALMRWLLRLVTPPGGGLVLDPFLGSGTTAVAATLEGIGLVGLDNDAQPASITTARARVAYARSTAHVARAGRPWPPPEPPAPAGAVRLFDPDTPLARPPVTVEQDGQP